MPTKQPLDLSGLRIAMEHMLHYQGLNLDKAAAFFVLYATGLVHDHCGEDRAQAILDVAQVELHKEAQKKSKRTRSKKNS